MSFGIRLIKTSSPSNKINKTLDNASRTIIDLKNRPKDLNNLDIDLSN